MTARAGPEDRCGAVALFLCRSEDVLALHAVGEPLPGVLLRVGSELIIRENARLIGVTARRHTDVIRVGYRRIDRADALDGRAARKVFFEVRLLAKVLEILKNHRVNRENQ